MITAKEAINLKPYEWARGVCERILEPEIKEAALEGSRVVEVSDLEVLDELFADVEFQTVFDFLYAHGFHARLADPFTTQSRLIIRW